MFYDKFYKTQTFYFHHDQILESQESNATNRHYHNLFEIYFITEGECTYFIDTKTYRLEPGDLILIPDGIIHNTKYRNCGHSRMLINCSYQYIPATVRPLLPSMLYLYRNPSIYRELYDIFKKIQCEYARPDSLTDDILRCYTHMLFFLLARNRDTCVPVGKGNEAIEKAVNYIQKNFSSELNLSDLSKLCGMSPEHFSRMFKQETGFGFSKYLSLLRLQKAELLLRGSDEMTITKIAGECGFGDSNYFSVKFKNFYGISPKQMQKQENRKQTHDHSCR